MLGYLSLLLLLHTVYSAARWRQYLKILNEQAPFPIDIIVELCIALLLALIVTVSNSVKFKKIRQFTSEISYDRTFTRKNFKNYNSQRAQIFKKILQQKLGTSDFRLSD